MNWIKTNRIVAGLILLFTLVIYTMTVAPTVSFWDCGEFIATAFRMAVPHPPGSPLFLLVGRVFSMLPIPGDVAFRVNMISVISSAFTIMFLYLSIVQLMREWKGGRLESAEDWQTAIFSGVIGSLTFAFTHSFWFNSSEAEVYAASMLFTALLVWLSLVWAEKSEEENNEKYLLMIAYLVGLAISVHLLNVLAIPFVAMVYFYKRYEFTPGNFITMTLVTVVIMAVVYPGVVKYLPLVARGGFFWLYIIFAAVLAGAYYAVSQKKHLLSFVMLSLTLIMIGYSSYAMIVIRSSLNPNIDENNPETAEKFLSYINREQYGESSPFNRTAIWKSSPNGKRYASVGEFFWKYQINKMYNRYFLWQFVGMDPVSGRWNWQFLALPLLIGLIGMIYHFRGDPKHALAVLALFFATGLAIILYLNQPDPQPRERDYSYVGSFFAFSIWVGMGFAGIMEMIREMLRGKVQKLGSGIMLGTFVLLMLASPLQMLAKNFKSHNRTGNYVAADYSYNMLMSCEPNALLFTNGDNDTFPLWYLQEVEGVRTDVRIVNLSLLNTDWYIEQLRDLEPRVPMKMSDDMLKNLSLMPWKTQEVTLKVPPRVADSTLKEYRAAFRRVAIDPPREIKFKVQPTFTSGPYKFLRVQDYMILNILTANRWKKPVYFATTVPRENMVGGLSEYMRMEGLVLKVVPFKDWAIDPQRIERNLLQAYRYRFQDPDVYYNPSIISLLQNYRTAFIQLAEYYARMERNKEKMARVLNYMDEQLPPETVPWGRSLLSDYRDAFKVMLDSSYVDTVLARNDKPRKIMSIARVLLMNVQEPALAARLAEKAYEVNPNSAEIVGLLVNAYEFSNQLGKAISALDKWLETHPDDRAALQMKRQLELRQKN